MKAMRLKRKGVNYTMLLDDADFEILCSKSFWLSDVGYAMISSSHTGTKKHMLVHRFVLGLSKGDGKVVDHINFNTLDNRKQNLQIVTQPQNVRKARKIKHHDGRPTTSLFKGVHRIKKAITKPWSANIKKGPKQISLGTFATEREAALAYNEAAKQLHGEFAVLNEVT